MKQVSPPSQFVLRMICRDAPGIIAWVTGLVTRYGGNILNMQEHVERDSGLFITRIVIEHLQDEKEFIRHFCTSCNFAALEHWEDSSARRQRMAILVTQEEICLYDLLMKQKMGELSCDIPVVISNREELAWVTKPFHVPFHFLPIVKDNVRAQEKKIEEILEKNQIDLVVLARYMRILSEGLVAKWQGKMINIHHGFLPAFKGARPYHQAWERGVKMIGATAHYVTRDLDEGPIIHQETTPVGHHFSVEEMIRAGRELERTVLTKAVRAHLEHRVVLLGHRTIVFNF